MVSVNAPSVKCVRLSVTTALDHCRIANVSVSTLCSHSKPRNRWSGQHQSTWKHLRNLIFCTTIHYTIYTWEYNNIKKPSFYPDLFEISNHIVIITYCQHCSKWVSESLKMSKIVWIAWSHTFNSLVPRSLCSSKEAVVSSYPVVSSGSRHVSGLQPERPWKNSKLEKCCQIHVHHA